MALLEEPRPDQRIQHQPNHGDALGAFPRPTLRLLDPEELFGIFEGVLDGPATGEGSDDLGRPHRKIGGEKEVEHRFA
jgi:hypothetical protein